MAPPTMPPLLSLQSNVQPVIPAPASVGVGAHQSVTSALSTITSSTYYNVTEDEMMKTLLKQVYASEVQSKCKFVQDNVLYCCNHEDQNHISQVILNGIGVDPNSSREERESKWAGLCRHIQKYMQEHRNKTTQNIKLKIMECKYLCIKQYKYEQYLLLDSVLSKSYVILKH
jgi:hypothetical protein